MKQVVRMMKSGWAVGLVLGAAMAGPAGAQTEQHGRNWKPLPATAHIEVVVLKDFNGKPLANAAVVFHAVRDGRNDGNLEVKTDPEGKAVIDVIEVGSHVTVQVIASGYATTAREIDVTGPSQALEIKLIRPRAQISKYEDNDGKPSDLQPGVQEPPHPIKTSRPVPDSAAGTTAPKQPVPVPGPLNAPPGAVTVPTQPGAPVTVLPPTPPAQAIPPQSGSTQSGSPQR